MEQSNQKASSTPQTEGSKQFVKDQQESKSGRIRPWHIAILGGLGAFGPLATDMYLPSLPMVRHDLGATMAQAQITLSACILGLSLGQVIAGPMSDAQGRRRPLLIGVAAFVVASLLCTFAPTIEILTIFRFIQGIAGAAGISIALAIASDLYTGTALARSFSLLMMVNALAPILAPVIGSQLLNFTSWRGVFIVLTLIGLSFFLATTFGLGETLPVEHRQKGGIAIILQAFRELLTDRRFIGYALSCSLAFATGIIYISVSPFVLQNVYHLSPQIFGLIFGINALGLALVAQTGSRLVDRVTPYKLMYWGIITSVIGGMILLIAVVSDIGFLGVLIACFIITASLGLIAPNATTLALSGAKAAGSASALLGVLQFSIGAIFAPLVGLAGSTALPMAIAIATFSLATLLTFVLLCRPARTN
ncbi:multidrug effflux MFS transporter [Dictyobacter alpinus]|nr:multidrug effflux MFS transporter [Dictyobacter alpinus]